MTTYFTGVSLPDDLYYLFADLQLHKCIKCSGVFANALGEYGEIEEFAKTLVDKDARPIGLVCKDCYGKYKQFVYRSPE
jgi:hypothetical protein